jgi:hypothetical protein
MALREDARFEPEDGLLDDDATSELTPVNMNRTGLVGGPIQREDGAHGTTQQVLPGSA